MPKKLLKVLKEHKKESFFDILQRGKLLRFPKGLFPHKLCPPNIFPHLLIPDLFFCRNDRCINLSRLHESARSHLYVCDYFA